MHFNGSTDCKKKSKHKRANKASGNVRTLKYEGWNFNSGNYLFTTDTKYMHVSKFYCPSM